MKVKRKVNIDEVEVDKNLREDEGWVRMDVQWLVSEETTGSKELVVGRTIFGPGGGAHEHHTHPNAEEVLYVVRGQGVATSGDEEFEIKAGDVLYVPRGDVHFFKNTHPTEDMETIWIYAGAPSLEKAGYETVDK